ncbi:response regulator [Chloracidobacterium aggregatum]|uniref:Response regulator n=1 Tax=Chloracidobacterium sp. N TaxID=2821540 RepID=A0ABX8AYL4_9BACT|nr:response regulator [Chloracidobacterium aggregatum]QUV83829.1 response regulator [Chloracidobacterium sp. 2]QUV87691.1 response regulator [Chloracidobacterium sp. S]QUV90590.1 response regulator [Chloracidobacterium sp. A]QUV93803.1 response regulator [Chloracidobacterium sp. N]QUV96992.1 response regulator [Chloracidobacterium sp. E]
MPKPLILIADDEEMLCELYAELLQPHYEIVLAHNGTKAREKALSTPGLCGILMDVQMPGMNGLQVAREVLVKRPEVRIIIMSGTDVTYRVRQMFASEQVAFLVKPFELEALLSLVKQHFNPPVPE